MNIYKKLNAVQTSLKAPKNQFNKFGGYKYRSCEDILEAVKTHLKENGLVLLISDNIETRESQYQVEYTDNDKKATMKTESKTNRVYVKATAKLIDIETGESIEVSAYAREEESKKGMDGSQVTGASSSYARKYALNGLFAIDDNKDSDTTNTNGANNQQQQKPPAQDKKADAKKRLWNIAQEKGFTVEELEIMAKSKYKKALANLTQKEFENLEGQILRNPETLKEWVKGFAKEDDTNE